jgi:hypothetical protein
MKRRAEAVNEQTQGTKGKYTQSTVLSLSTCSNH